MLPHCGGRDGKCFQCSAAGCLRLPAKLIPHVAFLGLLPQMVTGHLQALLGLVLLVHSTAGWSSAVREEGRLRLAPLSSEDSFARACRKRVATIAINHVRKHLEAGSLNRVLEMGYFGETRGEVPPEP